MSPLTDHLDRLDRSASSALLVLDTDEGRWPLESLPRVTDALREIDARVTRAERAISLGRFIEVSDLRRILDRITGSTDE